MKNSLIHQKKSPSQERARLRKAENEEEKITRLKHSFLTFHIHWHEQEHNSIHWEINRRPKSRRRIRRSSRKIVLNRKKKIQIHSLMTEQLTFLTRLNGDIHTSSDRRLGSGSLKTSYDGTFYSFNLADSVRNCRKERINFQRSTFDISEQTHGEWMTISWN